MKQLLLEDGILYEKIALIEDGKLQDFHISKKDNSVKKGDIFLGKVVNILDGMDSAFLDIGLKTNGYLHIQDIIGKNDIKNKDIKVSISNLLKKGRDYVVQVIKEPAGTKGPKLTMKPSISGKYSVLLIEDTSVKVSRKIIEKETRDKYHEAAKDVLYGLPYGAIIRTECIEVTVEEFVNDLKSLIAKWGQLSKGIEISKAPKLIYSGENIYDHLKNDFLQRDIDKIICVNDEEKSSVSKIVDQLGEDYNTEVVLHKENVSLFRDFNVESQIEESLGKKVNIEDGGFLYIEETEAMTIIDVNSGKYIGKYDTEKTFLDMNMRAAKEIARQLRIRNTGGIVLIDFIDMKKESSRKKVIGLLQEEFIKDRNGCNILGFTRLGFLEMTRKKQQKSIKELLTWPCSFCDGEGFLINSDYMMNHVIEEIRRIIRHHQSSKIQFKVSRIFYENIDKKFIEIISEEYGVSIEFTVDEELFQLPKIKRIG
jgi:ribonuclease G